MANINPGFEQLWVDELTKELPPSVRERLAQDLNLSTFAKTADLQGLARTTDLQGLASSQSVVDLTNTVATLLATVDALGRTVTALSNALSNKADKTAVRAFVEQSGSSYPTPPAGYPALDVNGALDPATVQGFPLGDYDVWNSGSGA